MKNIIFDLGEVLIKGKSASVLDKMSLSDEEYRILYKFFEDWDNLDLGIETLEEKYSKCNFNEEIDKKYKNILLSYYQMREFNMNMFSLAQILKTKGYKLFILSDNNAKPVRYYHSIKLFDIFDGWIISSDYHAVKKDGKLFEIMLDEYNLKPEECYFIDDNQENVTAAKKYGITGYVYNEKENIDYLYKNMRENGINI